MRSFFVALAIVICVGSGALAEPWGHGWGTPAGQGGYWYPGPYYGWGYYPSYGYYYQRPDWTGGDDYGRRRSTSRPSGQASPVVTEPAPPPGEKIGGFYMRRLGAPALPGEKKIGGFTTRKLPK